MKDRVFLHSVNCISSAGLCLADFRRTILKKSFQPLRVFRNIIAEKSLAYGFVEQIPDDSIGLDVLHTRTSRLIARCLEGMRKAKEKVSHFAPSRIAVIAGATTSGMREVESAQLFYKQHGQYPQNFSIAALNLNNPAQQIAQYFGAQGPVYTVSNACASGAAAIAAGAQLLQSSIADAVICGGIDGYSRFTTQGFLNLGVVSPLACQPFSADRCGINLGEGGALVLLTKEESPVELAGFGLSCDAYHPSAPDPSGAGAAAAMRGALASAGIAPEEVNFISAHGTATRLNDAMEAKAIHAVFGPDVPVASLKPYTGHTLAGAGALQAAIAWAMICDNPQGILPANRAANGLDPELDHIALLQAPVSLGHAPSYILGNAFAFGGSNVSLLFRCNL